MVIYVKKLSIFLLLLVLFHYSGCSEEIENTTVSSVDIVHINSLRGKIFSENVSDEEGVKKSGISLISSTLNKISDKISGKLIKIANSNFLYGTPEAYFTQGECIIEYLNLLKFDCLVVGHREFYFGQNVLAGLSKLANFPFLSCNIIETKTGKTPEYLKPYTIVEHEGTKIAIIGFSTRQIITNSLKSDSEGLDTLSIQPTVEKYVNELKDKVSLIYVVGDLMYGGNDPKINDTIKDLLNTDGINGFFMKTENERLFEKTSGSAMMFTKQGRKIGFFLVKEKGYTLGHYHLESNNVEHKIYNLNSEKIEPDYTLADGLYKLKKRLLSISGQVIAKAETDITHSFEKESPLGNFVTDALRQYTKADVVIANSGSLRHGIEKGPINKFDIYRVLPFRSTLLQIKLSGKDLLEILEASVMFRRSKSFLQISGLKFKFDTSKPKGSRVINGSVLVNKIPVDKDKMYTLVCTEFLYDGGDGYYEFKTLNLKIIKTYNYTERDIVSDYLMQEKKVSAKVEGRAIDVASK